MVVFIDNIGRNLPVDDLRKKCIGHSAPHR